MIEETMKDIKYVKDLELGEIFATAKLKDVREIFNGNRRRIVEVTLRNNETLWKHKASEPISVFCLGGRGTFLAGPDLRESTDLRPGTLLTLEANVEHEVLAEPDLHILVTKFKCDSAEKGAFV